MCLSALNQHAFIDQQKSRVFFEVEDNGIGMTDDELDHCLEPFYTTKEVGLGTGIGLSIVFNLVKGVDGALEIKSQKIKGTLFQIILPCEHDALTDNLADQ